MSPRPARSGLRVAVVTTSLWPGSNELWEGAAGHVDDLLLLGAGVDAGRGVLPQVGLRAHDAGRGWIYTYLEHLRREVRSFGPDLLHVNGELWGLPVQQSLWARVPVVAHGAENQWSHGGRVEQVLRRRLLARALRSIVGYASWNEAGARHVSQRAPRGLPVLTLPGIIPPTDFRGVRWQGAPRGLLRLLVVGRLVPEKGFDTVLRAAERLGGRDVEVVVCGEGPGRSALQALAASGTARVRFRGQVDAAALAREMSRASFLVQPSRTTTEWSEQFGRTVAEAMTVGLPCLVSDSGELPTVVGHDPLAVFAEGDASALAERVTRLLDRPGDLAALTSRQAGLASAWSPGSAGSAVAQFWRTCLHGR